MVLRRMCTSAIEASKVTNHDRDSMHFSQYLSLTYPYCYMNAPINAPSGPMEKHTVAIRKGEGMILFSINLELWSGVFSHLCASLTMHNTHVQLTCPTSGTEAWIGSVSILYLARRYDARTGSIAVQPTT